MAEVSLYEVRNVSNDKSWKQRGLRPTFRNLYRLLGRRESVRSIEVTTVQSDGRNVQKTTWDTTQMREERSRGISILYIYTFLCRPDAADLRAP